MGTIQLPPVGGAVSSVGLTMPDIFGVANSPVTTADTIAVSLVTQVKNKVFAGPATGADAAPSFRDMSILDVPSISESLTSYTPADTDTVTMDYSAGTAKYIDLSAITTGTSVTLAVSNAPDNTRVASMTLVFNVAATLGTVNWPAGFTDPGLTVSKESWFKAMTMDGGTTWRLFKLGEF